MKKILLVTLVALFLPQIQVNTNLMNLPTNQKLNLITPGNPCTTLKEKVLEDGPEYTCSRNGFINGRPNLVWSNGTKPKTSGKPENKPSKSKKK